MVEFRDVTVRQGAVVLLDHVTFTINRGEHWALVGPNGSGKSTLLSLILADNPQAFANHIRVAGRQLGPGCGIWEIKALLGWVSPELDAHYPPDATPGCRAVGLRRVRWACTPSQTTTREQPPSSG